MWSHSRSDPPEGHKAAVLVAQHYRRGEVAQPKIAGHRADSPDSMTVAEQGVHGETAWPAGTVWTLWTAGRPDSPSPDAGRRPRCPGLPEDRRGGPVQTGARDCRRLGRPIADTPLAPPRQLLIHNVDCVTGPRGLFTQSRYIMLSRGAPALPMPPGRRSADSSPLRGRGQRNGEAAAAVSPSDLISWLRWQNCHARSECSTTSAGRPTASCCPHFPRQRASFMLDGIRESLSAAARIGTKKRPLRWASVL